jgi:hypothetical protein
MRTREPRLAIAIPHPTEKAYAVDARTQTLPAWKQVDSFELEDTWERLAINLAGTVTGSRLHSVDHRLVSEVQQTLYLMKPNEDTVLEPGYDWMDCDIESVKSRYDQLDKLKSGRLRESLTHTAMQALALHTLFEAIHTPRQSDVLLSWFAENLGMHNLDPIPTM